MADPNIAKEIAFNIQMLANSAPYGDPIRDIIIAASNLKDSRLHNGSVSKGINNIAYAYELERSASGTLPNHKHSYRAYEDIYNFREPTAKADDTATTVSIPKIFVFGDDAELYYIENPETASVPVILRHTNSDLALAVKLLADAFADKVQTSMQLSIALERDSDEYPLLIGIRERWNAEFGAQRDLIVVDTKYDTAPEGKSADDYCFVIPLPNSGPDTISR